MILAVILFKNQKVAIHNFLFINKWSDKEFDWYNRNVSQSIFLLSTKQLDKAVINY